MAPSVRASAAAATPTMIGTDFQRLMERLTYPVGKPRLCRESPKSLLVQRESSGGCAIFLEEQRQ
jgi:hypothetical protein